MRIIQTNSISLNGMLARENGEEDWLPVEGWDEFVNDVKEIGNFIMGRKTYELVMKLYPDHNFDDVETDTKIIVTSQDDYECPEGYTLAKNPEEAVDILKSKGFEAGLLIGGGGLNSSFYESNLVDEVWVTINPIILGQGRPFIGEKDIEVKLSLNEVVELSKDRVQLRYRVDK